MSMEKNQVFRCNVCGLMVEVLRVSEVPPPICCGKPMQILNGFEQEKEGASEKHLPVATKTSEGILVQVGSVPHPMLPEHHIEWIELIAGDYLERKYLDITGKPEAVFCVPDTDSPMEFREYCNIHGLWKTK